MSEVIEMRSVNFQPMVDDKDKEDMKKILESLGGFEETQFRQIVERSTESAVDEIRSTAGFREVLDTQKTNQGFIYGEWELIERKAQKKSYFTIRHSGTAEVLAKDILLRESALALIKMLNEGRPINSSECFRALEADMKYRSALFDMANLKRSKSAINEDKFEMAKARAVSSKKTATKLLERLRGINA